MELINEYEINKDMITEFMKRAMRTLVLYSFVIGLGGLFFSIVLFREENKFLLGVVVAASLVSLITGILIVPYTVKEHMKQVTALHGSNRPKTMIRFTEEGIFLNEGDASIKREYTNVVQVFETKHLWMLMFGKYMGIPVRKDGFTHGTNEDFRKLMKEVLPANVKGRDKL